MNCSQCPSGTAVDGLTRCRTCINKNKKKNKELRELHLSNGLCRSCNNPCEPGKTRCAFHIAKHRRSETRRRKERKNQGECPQCGGAPAEDNVLCTPCQERFQKYHTKRVDGGSCQSCPRPRTEHSAYCLTCYFKKCARMNLKKKGKEATQLGRDLHALFDSQGGLCALTGLPMLPGVNASVDHVVPRSKGGLDEVGNLRWIRREMNDFKGDRTDEEILLVAKAFVDFATPSRRW